MQRDIPVASDLQRALITEIETILKSLQNASAEEEWTNGFTGYAQFLPVMKNDDEDIDQFFPYFIVRLQDGKTTDDYDMWTVTADILIGIHDDDENNRGHFHIMNAIDRITRRFCEEPTIGTPGHKAFRCLPEMQWDLQDEDTYPYYFGGVELKFWVPKPGRREPRYGD